MIRRRAYEAAADAEVRRWPGVRFWREQRGRHPALILEYADRRRIVTMSGTPGGDPRGLKNQVAEIRRKLRELGAERQASHP